MITINPNVPFILFYDLEHNDLMKVVNLTNELIMFDAHLKELESVYSLDLSNMSYTQVLDTMKQLDQKLFELIETKSA